MSKQIPSAPYTILVIDDNPVDRLAYQRMLARRPGQYKCIEAEMGEAGLAMYRQHQPDCILLDYNLPDLNAIDFLDALQQQTQSATTLPQPVIILTGEGNEEVAVATMKRGAQDYLIKGRVDYERLHRSIQNTIEKMHLQQQLRQEQQALKDFAHAAAHDLKSPLTQISNYCQLLRSRYNDQLDERGQLYIQEILAGTHQMNALIEALLSYARAGRPTSPLTLLPVALLIERAAKQLATEIAQSDASITQQQPMASVYGDEIQLVRLFQNLLSNAIKFSGPRPPQISISCTETPQYIQIAVRDHGIGIAPEDQSSIFQPFTRLPDAQALPGHGIGLASCQKIAEQHQGHLRVEVAPDIGTIFILELPKYNAKRSS